MGCFYPVEEGTKDIKKGRAGKSIGRKKTKKQKDLEIGLCKQQATNHWPTEPFGICLVGTMERESERVSLAPLVYFLSHL